MHRLLEIGFVTAGHWYLENDALKLQILRHSSQSNVLYAVVSDGLVMYIGKTTKTLAKRMYGYQNPSQSQRTNVRNNRLIKELIKADSVVDLLVLPDNGLLHYGMFHLNLAAGLEDSLIATIQPPWNGKQTAESEDDSAIVSPDLPVFLLTLHKTYWEKGFFNVPTGYSQLIGSDGESIQIELQGNQLVNGLINRSSNSMSTPRIFGGVPLRNWFQEHCKLLAELKVTLKSPYELKIDLSFE